MAHRYWLMKAEPDSRIVKGKDVKVPIFESAQERCVDDFETTGTTAWEGVRNAEARNIMKSMHVGDKVLFYHSNCKNPGIAAFAEVSKEAYPDYTAWDPDHPYYDAKTDKTNPKWYMVDVTFHSRAKNFVPLSLIKHLASLSPSSSSIADPPDEIIYIGKEGMRAIREMALVNRGRLSVQPVEETTYGIIETLAERGGWEGMVTKPTKHKTGKSSAAKKPPTRKAETKITSEGVAYEKEASVAESAIEEKDKSEPSSVNKPRGRKRKADTAVEEQPTRRSTRAKK